MPLSAQVAYVVVMLTIFVAIFVLSARWC